jgi:hypothetical protein
MGVRLLDEGRLAGNTPSRHHEDFEYPPRTAVFVDSIRLSKSKSMVNPSITSADQLGSRVHVTPEQHKEPR